MSRLGDGGDELGEHPRPDKLTYRACCSCSALPRTMHACKKGRANATPRTGLLCDDAANVAPQEDAAKQ